MNKLDPFEKLIKSKLEKHKVDFTFDSWDAIENKLPKSNNNMAFAISIGLIAIVVLGILISKSNNKNSEIANNNKVVEFNSTLPIVNTNKKSKTKISEEKTLIQPQIKNENTIEFKKNDRESKELSPNVPVEKNTNQQLEIENEILKVDKIEVKQPINTDENNLVESNNEDFFPVAEFSVNKTAVCCNEPINFLSNQNRDLIYHWDFDDGNSSNVSSPTHLFSEPGNYSITLKATNKENPNQFSVSVPVLVTVYPSPSADFTHEKIVEEGVPQIKFLGLSTSNNYVKWYFGDGTTSNLSEVNHRYYNKGIYDVTFEQTNSYNCIASSTQQIEILENFNLFAPNSFTPDGDGVNDTFIPESLKLMNVSFTMNIYNKQGKLIFSSKNINNPWDGINQNNGQKCSQGSFIWVVQLTNKNGKNEQYNGALLLLN